MNLDRSGKYQIHISRLLKKVLKQKEVECFAVPEELRHLHRGLRITLLRAHRLGLS